MSASELKKCKRNDSIMVIASYLRLATIEREEESSKSKFRLDGRVIFMHVYQR